MLYIVILIMIILNLTVLHISGILRFNITVNGRTEVKMDPVKSRFYMDALEKMINYYSIFKVDEKFGVRFRESKAITFDISNEDIIEVRNAICISILEAMGPNMKIFLYIHLSQEWVHEYIKMRATDIIIEYASKRIVASK